MCPRPTRGKSRRTSRATPCPSAVVCARITSTAVLDLVRAKGFYATRRMLDHAILRGHIPRPAASGNYRWFTADHVLALCTYLREHSRAQARALPEGGAE